MFYFLGQVSAGFGLAVVVFAAVHPRGMSRPAPWLISAVLALVFAPQGLIVVALLLALAAAAVLRVKDARRKGPPEPPTFME